MNGLLDQLYSAHCRTQLGLPSSSPAATAPPATRRRAVAALDVEATGTDPEGDRIVEVAVIRIEADGTRREFSSLVWPQRGIPAEASEIHGIEFEAVKDAAPFSELAPQLLELLSDCDLVAYGGSRLDLPILGAEFDRAGLVWAPDLSRVFDPGVLAQELNPRNLGAMVQQYLGRPHEGAHRAMGDAAATLELLGAMVARHGLSEDEALSLSRHKELPYADLAGKLRWDGDGDLCFAFGKNRGVKVKNDIDFAEWMLNAFRPPFPRNTCAVLQAEVDRLHPPQANRRLSSFGDEDYDDSAGEWPDPSEARDEIPDPAHDAVDVPGGDEVPDIPSADIPS